MFLVISAAAIYIITISSSSRYVVMLKGEKPNSVPKGVNGKIRVITATDSVAIRRYLPGRLLKNGCLLRITRTIIDAEITDSMNHPVLN